MVDVSKDMIIESPAKVAHRLCNETSPEFRVLVVQVPRPTEKGKLL
jgi:mannose-6-phosphate isomerase-like protein (cupin superfamily)